LTCIEAKDAGLYRSNDGGIGISTDGGATWLWPALPTPQLYNIDADDRFPYHVGGTIQDWGTASGPAYTLRQGDMGGGPTLGDFWYVVGGEAGDFVYDRAAPGTVYAGEGIQVPLPVVCADRRFATRPEGAAPRRQRAFPHDGPRGNLGGDQPGPHAQ
jgi:hypothetical protein